MSGILSRTCSLRPGESVTSFVSRLAARNHVASAAEFSLDMGLNFQAIVDGDPSALDTIARLSGMPATDLARGSIRKIGTRYGLGDECLSKANLRRSRLRACPVCLRNDLNGAIDGGEPTPYGRTEWLLAVMRVCPIHACALVEVAAAPKDAPRSTHDFTLLLREQLPDLDRLLNCMHLREPSSLEGYVRGRLQGAMGQAPWLDRMELHAAITTCEMLGVLVTVGPAARLRALGEEDWHTAGDAGHRLACEGEGAIKRGLSEVERTSERHRRDREGPSAIYGVFYDWLAHNQKDSAYDFIRDLLREHMIETKPYGAGDIVLGRPVDRRRLHSIWTASNETGRHPKRLRTILAAAGLISPAHRDLPDHRVVFDAETAETFLQADISGLSRKRAETYLNIGRVQAKLLADHGLIQHHVAHTGVRKVRRATYTRSDLDAFLERLLDGAEPVEHPHDDDTHTITSAARRANCSVVEIVRLIVDKTLLWIGRKVNEVGYDSVLVRLSEIKTHVHGLAYDGITAGEAERRLMTSTPVVVALIHQGYLPRHIVINPINRCPVEIIRHDDMDRFCATYTTIKRLAADTQMSIAATRKKLNGIEAAIGKDQVGTRFYRHDQIPI